MCGSLKDSYYFYGMLLIFIVFLPALGMNLESVIKSSVFFTLLF